MHIFDQIFSPTHKMLDQDLKRGIIKSHSDLTDLLSVGNRCASAKCKHLCTDRGGATVECSCRTGYEIRIGWLLLYRGMYQLRTGGVREFRLSTSTVCAPNERYEETIDGGYRCLTEDGYQNDSTMNARNFAEAKTALGSDANEASSDLRRN
uniref:Ig-like domain-containing protein n=1 Tax=Loa loa TaxID=7209 RepID=A0A1I7VDS4_LOALO